MKIQFVSEIFPPVHSSILRLLTVGLLLCALAQTVAAQEIEGSRPYELDWAGRFSDDHEPLIDFEELEGWTIKATGGKAEIFRSEEQKIWGIYTAKIKYKGDTGGASFVVSPPVPVKIPDPFTDVNMWVWNDYWKWEDDRDQPIAKMSILLETNTGDSYEIPFCRELDWPGWYILHIRLNAKQREAFEEGGVMKGFRISNCLRAIEDSIFFDNLSFFVEDYSTPLEYDVLPRPGIDLAPGQDLGVHTGQERLPFPTRDETILPQNVCKNFKTELVQAGDKYIFRYSGEDGVLEYRYKPQRGDLGDVTAEWMDGSSGIFRPMDNGGVEIKIDNNVEGLIQERFGGYIAKEKHTARPSGAELIDCKISGETLNVKWRVGRGSPR